MKQIIISIPDNKFLFVKQLLDEFDYIKIHDEDIYDIPEEVQNMVMERLESVKKNPKSLISNNEMINFLDEEK